MKMVTTTAVSPLSRIKIFSSINVELNRFNFQFIFKLSVFITVYISILMISNKIVINSNFF